MTNATRRKGGPAALLLAGLMALLMVGPVSGRPAEAQVLQGKPVRLKDLASISGARSNLLHGVGLVVGLEGTGDSQSTGFTERALRNFIQAAGMYPTERLRTRNVAVVSEIGRAHV